LAHINFNVQVARGSVLNMISVGALPSQKWQFSLYEVTKCSHRLLWCRKDWWWGGGHVWNFAENCKVWSHVHLPHLLS